VVNHDITNDIFIKRHSRRLCPLHESSGGNIPAMHPLFGVSGFYSFRIHTKTLMSTLSVLAWAVYGCGTHFDEIGSKSTFVQHCLANFIVISVILV